MAELAPALLRAFERLARAVEEGDVEAFRALVVEDAPAQEELFTRNSHKARERGWRLRLLDASVEGEVAELRFELVDSQGRGVDPGEATFTLESDGWRLRSL